MTLKRPSVSCGVSTAVGSSRISTCASRISAFRISTLCWAPTGRFSTRASGGDVEAELPGYPEDVGASLAPVEKTEPLDRLEAEDDVLGHGEDRDQHEVLVDHADAPPDGIAGVGEAHRFAVDADLAGIGVQQAEQDVHEGGLAGAVLSQKTVDLTLSRVRSTWSLATSGPKALVMPTSSSLIDPLFLSGAWGRVGATLA